MRFKAKVRIKNQRDADKLVQAFFKDFDPRNSLVIAGDKASLNVVFDESEIPKSLITTMANCGIISFYYPDKKSLDTKNANISAQELNGLKPKFPNFMDKNFLDKHKRTSESIEQDVLKQKFKKLMPNFTVIECSKAYENNEVESTVVESPEVFEDEKKESTVVEISEISENDGKEATKISEEEENSTVIEGSEVSEDEEEDSTIVEGSEVSEDEEEDSTIVEGSEVSEEENSTVIEGSEVSEDEEEDSTIAEGSEVSKDEEDSSTIVEKSDVYEDEKEEYETTQNLDATIMDNDTADPMPALDSNYNENMAYVQNSNLGSDEDTYNSISNNDSEIQNKRGKHYTKDMKTAEIPVLKDLAVQSESLMDYCKNLISFFNLDHNLEEFITRLVTVLPKVNKMNWRNIDAKYSETFHASYRAYDKLLLSKKFNKKGIEYPLLPILCAIKRYLELINSNSDDNFEAEETISVEKEEENNLEVSNVNESQEDNDNGLMAYISAIPGFGVSITKMNKCDTVFDKVKLILSGLTDNLPDETFIKVLAEVIVSENEDIEGDIQRISDKYGLSDWHIRAELATICKKYLESKGYEETHVKVVYVIGCLKAIINP